MRAFDRAWRRLVDALAATAATLLGVAALAVSADVLARNTGLGAFPWILEASEYVLPLATFLAAPWLLVRNEHIRLDVLLRTLPSPAARALERMGDAVGLAVSLALVVFALRATLESARQGSQVLKSIVFPEWWTLAPVPLCFALLAIEFARRLARSAAPPPTPPAQ